VFDQMAKAINDLPGRTAVPALLPWTRWPADAQTADGQQDDTGIAAVPEAASAPHDTPAARSRRAGSRMVLALGCVLVAVAAVLTVPLGRLGPGYLTADVASAAAVLLVLAVIAFRRRRAGPPLTPHAAFSALPEPPGPAEPREPHGASDPAHGKVPDDILAHAMWIMTAAADDESFRQLSSPGQLLMLSGEPHLARLVKFAPATARHMIDSATDGDFVAWTTAGDRVGVIRLVPLKAGLLRPS
jgi:hypothetical protein